MSDKPARTVAFKCDKCGAKKSVKLAAGVSTPTRVDCDKCGERDAVVPAGTFTATHEGFTPGGAIRRAKRRQ